MSSGLWKSISETGISRKSDSPANAPSSEAPLGRPLLFFLVTLVLLAAISWFAFQTICERATRQALDRECDRAVESARALADYYVRSRLRVEADRALDHLRNLVAGLEGKAVDEAQRRRIAETVCARTLSQSGGIFCLDADRRFVTPGAAERSTTQHLSRHEVRLALRRQREGYMEDADAYALGESAPILAIYSRHFHQWDWVVAAADYKRDLVREVSPDELRPLSVAAATRQSFEIFFTDRTGRPIVGPSASNHDLTPLADVIRSLPAAQSVSGGEAASLWWTSGANEKVVRRQYAVRAVPHTNWVAVVSVPIGWRSPEVHVLARVFDIHLTWLTVIVALTGGWAMLWITREARRLQRQATTIVERNVAARTADFMEERDSLETELQEQRMEVERLGHTNRELSEWVDQWKQSSYEFGLLSQTGSLLQACQSLDETDSIIAELVRELFPRTHGVLCRQGVTQNILEVVASWGDPLMRDSEIGVDDCWALRRGREYTIDNAEAELLCPHLPGPPEHGYVCLPMIAQGELLGLLHMQWGGPERGMSEEAWQRRLEDRKRMAMRVTEQFSLALANLKLREMLRGQSIRDQLTGLYNRRHMEESLTREMHRANRHQTPLGIIMLDVDHFKRFNDTHGHDDGDVLLRELGALLRNSIRQEDIACRYGGEEFLVIMPDAALDVVAERAEMLRAKVRKQLKLKQETVTISAGVAVYPEHGLTMEAVLSAADQALYQAKDGGRDRVVVWAAEEG